MKIWTIVLTRDKKYSQVETSVIGSYSCLCRSKHELASHIAARAAESSEFSFALWNDENHSELKDHILGNEKLLKVVDTIWIMSFFDRCNNRCAMPPVLKTALMEYVKGELTGSGCYYIYISPNGEDESYHFDIIENKLEGV